jgi:hypothetical protein
LGQAFEALLTRPSIIGAVQRDDGNRAVVVRVADVPCVFESTTLDDAATLALRVLDAGPLPYETSCK